MSAKLIGRIVLDSLYKTALRDDLLCEQLADEFIAAWAAYEGDPLQKRRAMRNALKRLEDFGRPAEVVRPLPKDPLDV